MKKVLIISYYYPPCELTPSQRSFSWAKHMNSFGIYPVVITRNWDATIKSMKDIDVVSGDRVVHEKFDTHEVYYIPHKGNFRTRWFGKNIFTGIRRMLTFFELILQNFTCKVSLYNSMFNFTLDYINNNKDIKVVLITGNPFYLFRLGYLANKKYAIKWVCDYRDDWTTSDLNAPTNIIGKVIHVLDTYYEKKWVKTSSLFTSVSPFYVNKIKKLTEVKGEVICNGYDEKDYLALPEIKKANKSSFKILFNGSLYATQKVEYVLNSVKRIVREFESETTITLSFIGLAFDEKQASRVKKQIEGFEKNIIITERIPRKDLFVLQYEADLLLMIGHNVKGTPGSKLYEYIGFKKPVLVCPTDHDIVEDTLKETGLGIFCEDEEDCYVKLKEILSGYLKVGKIDFSPNLERIESYSRYRQVEKMAQILNKIM